MPNRAEFIARLAPDLKKVAERERACYADMAELVAVQARVLGAIKALLDELGLERYG